LGVGVGDGFDSGVGDGPLGVGVGDGLGEGVGEPDADDVGELVGDALGDALDPGEGFCVVDFAEAVCGALPPPPPPPGDVTEAVPVPVAAPAGSSLIVYVPFCGRVGANDQPQFKQPVELSCVPSGPNRKPVPANVELAVMLTCCAASPGKVTLAFCPGVVTVTFPAPPSMVVLAEASCGTL
jgi:hypothetical protein